MRRSKSDKQILIKQCKDNCYNIEHTNFVSSSSKESLRSSKSSEPIGRQSNKRPVSKYINSKKVNEQTSDSRANSNRQPASGNKKLARKEALPVVNELLNEFDRLLNENNQNLKLNQKKAIAQLNTILNSKHLKAVMDAHDQLVKRDHYRGQYVDEVDSENVEMEEFGLLAADQQPHYNGKQPGQTATAQRIINIRKGEDEPLGITVKDENGQVMIARIMAGSLADRQGMLHVNDVILEVNGIPVEKPDVVQDLIRKNNSNLIQFRIIPSFNEQVAQLSCHMKALFNYDPNIDSLLPCKELGLPFIQGDILEILNQEDSNWWQARKVDSLNHNNLVNPQLLNQHMIINNQQIGLIPSQELEEKRRAFVRPEFDYATKTSICGTRVVKKKKKAIYSLNANTAFDNAELVFYEEVCRLNKFQRKCIVLIGASGVGRRTIKQRLIQAEPEKFAGVLPHTSRPIREGEVNGRVYHFVHREIMEREIEDSGYLEWGELQGHLYGTKLDSIRNVIRSGKICVIDCNPQSIKLLKTPEFLPFVVFLGAPPIEQLRFMHDWGKQNSNLNSRNCTFDRAMGRNSRRARTMQSLASFYEDEDISQTIEESNRIMRIYEKHFDLCLVNYNFDKTYHQLRDAIHQLETEPQLVPIMWVLHAE